MPSLKELEAKFIRRDPQPDGVNIKTVRKLSGAEGVMFLCPACFRKNRGRVGTHIVICWFTGVPLNPGLTGPGRWNPRGTGLSDLTFVGPGSFSVLIEGGCNWHGYVKNGHAD